MDKRPFQHVRVAIAERPSPKRGNLFQMLIPAVAGKYDVDVRNFALIWLNLAYAFLSEPFLKNLQLPFERALYRFVSRIYSTIVALLSPVMKYPIVLYLQQIRLIGTFKPISRQRRNL